MSPRDYQAAKAEKLVRQTKSQPSPTDVWPKTFVNRETQRVYTPHTDDERFFVESDYPTNMLAKGGEGAGKSVAGIIKDLRRLARGMSGIMVSPDLPHFRKSLWPEFKRWCPWQMVIDEHQYRGRFSWEPHEPFVLAFKNGTTLQCGGIEEPGAWEGPNVSFAHFDEARRARTADAIKVLAGRIRIPGPKNEAPQLYLTSTPRKHWLFEYFGPMQEPDEHQAFKEDMLVVTLRTADNASNLSEGFVAKRAQTLSAAEQRVLLDAEWEDLDDTDKFVPSMVMWDALQEDLPPLTHNEPLIIGLDAATGRKAAASDCFGLLGVTRHPKRPNDVAVRYVQKWQAKAGEEIQFDHPDGVSGPMNVLRRLKRDFHIYQVAYDPTQVVLLKQTLTLEGVAWFKAISQATGSTKQPGRGIYDPQLFDLITQRRLAHDGNKELRAHVDNANKKLDAEDRKMRIVKRHESLKIDLVICLSMAAGECLRMAL